MVKEKDKETEEAETQKYSKDQIKEALKNKLEILNTELEKLESKEIQEQMLTQFPEWKEAMEEAVKANQEALKVVYKRIQMMEQSIEEMGSKKKRK